MSRSPIDKAERLDLLFMVLKAYQHILQEDFIELGPILEFCMDTGLLDSFEFNSGVVQLWSDDKVSFEVTYTPPGRGLAPARLTTKYGAFTNYPGFVDED